MATFTVDTHLFRELGELLVGRDSTALIELVKNCYDADATEVTISGRNLSKSSLGRIVITDNGVGMNVETFEKGFLRIASRTKELGNRRSPCYGRRYTGAKGVGRLAAQKLAWNLSVLSVPLPEILGKGAKPIRASIDWKQIESCETLGEPGVAKAISLQEVVVDDNPGTEIILSGLRGKWSARERMRAIQEATTFQPPKVLLQLPESVTRDRLLINSINIRDTEPNKVWGADPGFKVTFEDEFDVGEDYWTVVSNAADWIIEIVGRRTLGKVKYLITPTIAYKKSNPKAQQQAFTWKAQDSQEIPSFHSRILVREGSEGIKDMHRSWLTDSAGVRVYMEGFRVLPYGDKGDDWLEIDRQYSTRSRTLKYLEDANIDLRRFGEDDTEFALLALRNTSYFGAVFLTRGGSPKLEMLVNREGFVPNESYLSMQQAVRLGIDLSTRVRAFEKEHHRETRRQARVEGAVEKAALVADRKTIRDTAEQAATKATKLAREARTAAASGKHKDAQDLIVSAAKEIERSTGLTGELITDRSIMQVLAGVGLQMSSFVHEMNALLGMANAIEAAVTAIRARPNIDSLTRTELARLARSVGDLRRVVERQASYLTDITSPDARRRRSRQTLSERFDASVRLVERAAEKRSIKIENRIPIELKSPPMFPAELSVVFTNLLTNAVKACKKHGRVDARGRAHPKKGTVISVQNTGQRVNLSNAEKWFLPFKSTTVEADPILGQGMGMGLPIVRNVLEEYGASVGFAKPTAGFATCVELIFP